MNPLPTKLHLRKRPDLVVQAHSSSRGRVWIVKDPVSLRYFQLTAEEYAILQWLDGRLGREEIRQRFAEQFAPRQLDAPQLAAFLSQLYRRGLVISDAPGQGEQLGRRLREQHRQSLSEAFLNPLAIRFRGVDPERLLNRLEPWLGGIFSPVCLWLTVFFSLAAVLLILTRFEAFHARLPGFDSFVAPANLFALAAVVIIAKVLHELGHGLACKHFGGECHEIGVMLLVGLPCLYCDVSDSWLLSSRWQRILVAAAGMYIELALASVATFLWWLSAPGAFQMLCLNVMIVCSVSTVLLNGNPLLRYDGYYILSDLLGIPNLASEAGQWVRGKLAEWTLGLEPQPTTDQSGLLAAYAVASTSYRLSLLIGILWFCYHALEPYRLEVLAQVLSLTVLAGIVAAPTSRAAFVLRDPVHRRAIRPARCLMTLAALVSLLAAMWLIPLPYRLHVTAVLEVRDPAPVYVTVSGRLVSAIPAGTIVLPGDTLGRLLNLDLDLQREQLAGAYDRQARRVRNLESQQVRDPEAAARLPSAREALADLEERLQQVERDAQRLVLTAPVGGTVLPPPQRQREKSKPADELPQWTGTPLDEHNRGSYLEAGTLFCLVGDPKSLEAVVTIDESEIEFVQPGQTVTLQMDQSPGTALVGTVREIARSPLLPTPRPGSRDKSDVLATTYQARVELHSRPPMLISGGQGRAKIAVAPQTLGARLSRFLSRAFGRPR